MTNSVDPDEMPQCGISSGSALCLLDEIYNLQYEDIFLKCKSICFHLGFGIHSILVY